MYTDLSACNTPFLKSNVAESVTELDSPDASLPDAGAESNLTSRLVDDAVPLRPT
jgi:hypothetical protein